MGDSLAMDKVKLGTNVFIPMPVVLVGTEVEDKVNFMTVSWVTRVNADPPLVGVGIHKSHATPEAIMANKAFSVCLPSRHLVEKADFCGMVSEMNADKSDVFTIFHGELKGAPMIADCPVCLECRLTKTVELPSNYFFVGEIADVYTEERFLTQGQLDPRKCDFFFLTMPDNEYWSMGTSLGRAWKIGARFRKTR